MYVMESLGDLYVNEVNYESAYRMYHRSKSLSDSESHDTGLLTPAWTFLMSNRRVDHQFWIDVGARGWSEPLQQPLTQPYVLSRNWPSDRFWGEKDEEREG